MRYAVLIRPEPDGTFQATVPAIPGLARSGRTREQTLASVREAIAAEVTSGDLVYVDVPEQPDATPNPWLATAGMFSDDETLEPMLKDIYAARDKVLQ